MADNTTPHPRPGTVYEFNKVRAVVVGVTEDDVAWHEEGHQKIRVTPRRYFEGHSRVPAPL